VVGPINGSTRLATVEPGEPLHAGDAACFIIPGHVYTSTVWFKVTPSASGELYASTANPGTNFDTVLALYTGTALNNLSLVACDNNGDTESPPGSSPLWSSILHAQVQAGQTYYLQLGGVGGATSGDYALTFRLTMPTVSIAPSSLSFGNVLVGTTSPAQTVTLTNTSTARMSIGSISSTPEFSRTTNCPLSPATLAGGASCTINVAFTPSASGARSGTLGLASNATGNPHTVGLSGSGTLPAAPQVSLAPSSLGFGNISVGSSSAAQTATLTNTGNAALNITSIATSGDFSETDTCPLSPSTLAAGGSCTISVSFSPTMSGPASGQLSVVDNATGNPHSVALTGTGTAPAVGLSTTFIDFGTVAAGTTSAPAAVTLTNTGTAPLDITNMWTDGDFAETDNCPMDPTRLAPGASCTINVSVTPMTDLPQTGSLTIVDDAPDTPQSVALAVNAGAAPMRQSVPTRQAPATKPTPRTIRR
jgi:hypothetical protein